MPDLSLQGGKPPKRRFVESSRQGRRSLGLTKGLVPGLFRSRTGKDRPPLIWLGTNTCGGDMLSLFNSQDPDYQSFITDMVDSRYDYLTMSAQGDMATGILDETMAKHPGRYILVVEGSIPTRFGGLCSVVGWRKDEPWTALQAVRELGARARYVVAAGTCAAFGGPYAAVPNPTDSLPIQAVVDKRVIRVPGCPIHPGWMMGTLAHLIWHGEPELDDFNRPKLFFGQTIHNLCQRRHYFDNSIFADQPGEPWCMYRIGCKGPVTYADCPYRQWSAEHVSWPVKANTPCIGCVSPEFPDGDSPFFKHLPDVYLPGVRIAADRVGALAAAVTALGIGAHLTGSIVTGRLGHTLRQGFTGRGIIGALGSVIQKLLGKHGNTG